MKYKDIVEKLLYSAGGTDNILKVRRDRNNLIFVIWDDQLINVSNLDKLDLLKKYKKAGINEVAFNIEIWNRELAKKIMPGKGDIKEI